MMKFSGWNMCNEEKRIAGLKGNLDLLTCGFLSGVVQAIMFNPWDRALYLSVKDTRPFLDLRNFHNPMKGMMQTLVQRAISSGMYFPLEDIFKSSIQARWGTSDEYRSLQNFAAGTLAGMLNGIIMNPSSSIKYHYWGKADCGKENFISTAMHMFEKGGVRPFFIGSTATLTRDVIFGGTYALLRHELQNAAFDSSGVKVTSDTNITTNKFESYGRFFINLFSGCVATLLSSPFNYVRNIHYATPPDTLPSSTIKIFQDLIEQTRDETTTVQKVKYLANRLRIGWGTARVGVGMAFGSIFYEYCSRVIPR